MAGFNNGLEGSVNDLGKPWRFKEGDLTVTRSCAWSAPGCHPTSCGVKLYVDDDGTLKKIEGDENHPVTKGRLCPRCLTLTDHTYNPSRVVYPMKRAREDRGKDKWERITWDEAYSLIEEKTAYYKENFGAESIMVLCGTGREGFCGASMAHAALGTPNACYTQSGYSCYVPRIAGTAYVLGAKYPEIDYAAGLPGGYDNPAFTLPEVIMLWGKEPLPSNGDGLFGHAIIDMMKRGTKLICVDPRVTWLGTRAEYVLQLRAGTDTALALAMARVIIDEDLYDHDFVENWTYGFAELCEYLRDPEKGMTVEKAAEICGVDAEDIIGAARLFATAKPASVAWGLAIDQKSNGVQNGHAVLSLVALTGNYDIPGGVLLADETDSYMGPSGRFDWEYIEPELQKKMVGMQKYPAYCNMVLNAQADEMLDTLETGEPYEMKMVFVYSSNPIAGTCCAQPKRWHDALSKIEFGFGYDSWITPTIQCCCEVFLPLATFAERDSVTYPHYGVSPTYTGSVTKALDCGETIGDLDLMWELGRRIMPQAWTQYETKKEFIEYYRTEDHLDLDELREKVCIQRRVTYRKYEKGMLRRDGEKGFNTPTGMFEFYSLVFENFGDNPMPYYEEPQYSPVSTPEVFEKYPFVLTTGARTYAYFHSEGKQIPYLRELNPDPLAEINPIPARKLGIEDGDWVRLENQFGSCLMKAKVTPTIAENTIHAQHGFWFPEEDSEEPNLYGVFRSNVNNLIPHHHIGKLGFGAPYKCCVCGVTKVNESYDTDMALVWEKFGKKEAL